MLLVLDAGNTTVTAGVYDGDQLVGPWRFSSRRERTSDEYGLLLRGLLDGDHLQASDIEGVAVSCVVPPLRGAIAEMCRRVFARDPLFVEPGIRTGLPILTENPQEVGADRIVNAVAAFARHGGPTIVVDFGTATTFDAISARGEYVGGVIAPGIGIAAEALFHRAARLPRVDLVRPQQVIGRNTVASMQSGLIYGYASLVDGIARRMQVELAPAPATAATVVATGGFAGTIAAECPLIEHVEPDLTLEGLKSIWLRNKPSGTRC